MYCAKFRAWFLLAAILTIAASVRPAHADTTAQPFACTVTAAAPFVRYQGLAEMVGDILLICTGGTPTTAGAAIPMSNIAVSIQSTNITSRLQPTSLPSAQGGFPYSEAVLAFDDPTPASPNPSNATLSPYGVTLNPCPSSDTGSCINSGTSSGFPSYGTGSNYNFFYAYQYDAHTLHFDYIPMDPPGPNQSMTIRITNVRIDATPYQSSSLSGIPVTATVSITGSQTVTISNPGAVAVAFPVSGVKTPSITPVNSPACNSSGSFTLQIQEGFNSAFKRQDTVISSDGVNVPATTSAIGAQNVFGYSYGTESGYYNPALSTDPTHIVGLATEGTRIWIQLKNVPSGVTVTAPVIAYLDGGATSGPVQQTLSFLTDGNGNAHSGYAHLVNYADSGGGGGYSPGTSSNASYSSTNNSSVVTFVYEILFSDPGALETLTVKFTASYTPNTPTVTSPATYIQALVSLGPVSVNKVNTAQVFGGGGYSAVSDTSVPRFTLLQSAGPGSVFGLTSCQCDLLLPYVVAGSGYETGIAITNSSLDPFGTTPQSGYVQLYYFPDYASQYTGVSGPFTQTTGVPLKAGDQLLMVLGTGSVNPGANIHGVPGFEGYIVVVADFQYCHGYVFVSDTKVSKFAMGYIGMVLDDPAFYRSGVPGESLSH